MRREELEHSSPFEATPVQPPAPLIPRRGSVQQVEPEMPDSHDPLKLLPRRGSIQEVQPEGPNTPDSPQRALPLPHTPIQKGEDEQSLALAKEVCVI